MMGQDKRRHNMCRLFYMYKKVLAPPSPYTMIATRAIQPYLSIGLYY
jgi:hypothetical protein